MSRKKVAKKDNKIKILRRVLLAVLILICILGGVMAYGINSYCYYLIFMPSLSVTIIGLLLWVTELYKCRNAKGIKNKKKDAKILANYGIFAIVFGAILLAILICGMNDLLVIPYGMWALSPIMDLVLIPLIGCCFYATVIGIYHYEKGLQSTKMLVVNVVGLALLALDVALLFI